MPHYEKLLIQIVNMAHICENDMIQIKDMFQIVATWLQFSTEEYGVGVIAPNFLLNLLLVKMSQKSSMKANFGGKNQKDMSDNGTRYAKIQHSKIKASFV